MIDGGNPREARGHSGAYAWVLPPVAGAGWLTYGQLRASVSEPLPIFNTLLDAVVGAPEWNRLRMFGHSGLASRHRGSPHARGCNGIDSATRACWQQVT